MRRAIEPSRRVARALVIELQGLGERDAPGVDSLGAEALGLVERRILVAFIRAQLPGVGQDQLIPRLPADLLLIEGQHRVSGAWISRASPPVEREADEGRRLHGAVHADRAEREEARTELLRVSDGIDGLVGEDELGPDVCFNRRELGPNLQLAAVQHQHGADGEHRVRVGAELQRARDDDARNGVGAEQVERDLVTGLDPYLCARCGHARRRPGVGVGPGAAAGADDRRVRAEGGHPVRQPGRRCVMLRAGRRGKKEKCEGGRRRAPYGRPYQTTRSARRPDALDDHRGCPPGIDVSVCNGDAGRVTSSKTPFSGPARLRRRCDVL